MKRVVWIQWHDAAQGSNPCSSRADDPEVHAVSTCIRESAGLLIHSNKRGVTLATDWDDLEGSRFSEPSFVPRGMILAERIFHEREPRPRKAKP